MDDRPCPNHPPPSELASVWCTKCGAWRLDGASPVEYIEDALSAVSSVARRRLGQHLLTIERAFDRVSVTLSLDEEGERADALREGRHALASIWGLLA
jgi:hypothetical protein